MKRIYFLVSLLFIGQSALAQENMPAYEKYKLKNKLQVIFMEYGSLPVTNISIYVNTGKKNETPGMQDISSITANSLLLGNAVYNRVQQDSIRYVLGTSISAGSNDNYTLLNMQFLNKDEDLAMSLLSGIIMKPAFPADEVGELIHQILGYEAPAKMNPDELAAMFSRFYVFGAGNPLGRHFYEAQLNKINAEQVREFYKFNYTPKNCTLVVCGKPDIAGLKALIEKHFAGWEAAYGENNGVSLSEPEISKKEYAFVNRSNGTQSALLWIKKAPAVGSKDQMAFEVANEMFSYMLNKAIREKEGKTYGIGSNYNEADNNSIYTVATRVRNEVVYSTMESFDRVLKQFYDSGAPAEVFEITKNQNLSVLKRCESPAEILQIFNPALYPDFDKRKKYLEGFASIEPGQVNKVIKKYFRPESYKMVIAGNEKDLKEQLDKIPGLVRFPLTAIEVDDVK